MRQKSERKRIEQAAHSIGMNPDRYEYIKTMIDRHKTLQANEEAVWDICRQPVKESKEELESQRLRYLMFIKAPVTTEMLFPGLLCTMKLKLLEGELEGVM